MATTLYIPSREYVDLDFDFSKHPISKNVSIKKQVNAVKQSIMHLLTLKEGDKPFHPEIKSPIYGYLFENASSIVKIVLESEVRKYLNAYEPRVDISTVTISYTDNNSINCEVSGEIINLSLPITVNIMVSRLR